MRGNESAPLPVLVRMCGKTACAPGAARSEPSAVSVKLATCCTMVVTRFDVTVRDVDEASRYEAVAWFPIDVPAGGWAWARSAAKARIVAAARIPAAHERASRTAR